MVSKPLQFLTAFWQRLVLLTAIAYLLISLLLMAGKQVYDQELKDKARQRHQYLLEQTESQVHEFILRITQDVQQLSILPSVQAYLAQPDAENRRLLEDTFSRTSAIYGRYDQIRLLGEDGQERIRVNLQGSAPQAVPQSLLQNKAERYYVREGLKLGGAEVYLSPLDLNQENGRIEQPLKPVIRAVIRLYGPQGEPSGLLVLNYRAGDFLNRFRGLFSAGDRGMLVNRDGYWLSNHERKNEWGWQTGQRDNTIEHWQPQLWQQMQQQNSGSYDTGRGLISFRQLQPSAFDRLPVGRFAASKGLEQAVKIRPWFVLVQTSRQQWLASAFYRHTGVLLFFASLYPVTLALIWLYLKHRADKQLNAEQQARYTEELEDLYYNAPIGYLTIGADTKITNANQQILAYLGYQRDELVGQKRLLDMLSPDSHKQLQAAIAAAENAELRMEVRCKDGRWLPVNSAISSKFDGSALTMSRCSVQDISLQLELEQRLLKLANTDDLTGAYNRRYTDTLFHEALEKLSDPERGGQLSILVLDIDHFKSINDRYGHGIGDEVLVAFTQLCHRCLGQAGHFARFGGEEFLALLPDTDLQQARNLAQQLCRQTRELIVTTSDRRQVQFTVSIGIALYQHGYPETLDQLIHRADEKLYQAKREGRDRVVG